MKKLRKCYKNMEEDKNLQKNLDNSNEELHISDVMFLIFAVINF